MAGKAVQRVGYVHVARMIRGIPEDPAAEYRHALVRHFRRPHIPTCMLSCVSYWEQILL